MDADSRSLRRLALALTSAVVLAGCHARLPPSPPAPLTYPGDVLAAPLLTGRVGPSHIYPDPLRTPGALNTNVTQETITTTICNPQWHGVNPWTRKDERGTASIRPSSGYTTGLKKRQMARLGLSADTGDYEEDHLISLELGGNPVDVENLWPEAYEPRPGAREKDRVESWLHDQVCAGAMTLHDAQEAIRTDWYAVYTRVPLNDAPTSGFWAPWSSCRCGCRSLFSPWRF